MKLSGLLGAKNVIVQLVWGERMLEFPTNICRAHEEGIVVQPYRVQGEVLNLEIGQTSHVVCNLFADSPEDGSRIAWRSLNVKTLVTQGECFYHMTASDFKKLSNSEDRRKDHRITVNRKAFLKEKGVSKDREVIVHDISDTGISFFAPLDFSTASNIVYLYFHDQVEEHIFDMNIECEIVRREKKAGNQFFGCKIKHVSNDYLVYGYMKKMAEVREQKELNRTAVVG